MMNKASKISRAEFAGKLMTARMSDGKNYKNDFFIPLLFI